jgi:hypothetical protein
MIFIKKIIIGNNFAKLFINKKRKFLNEENIEENEIKKL